MGNSLVDQAEADVQSETLTVVRPPAGMPSVGPTAGRVARIDAGQPAASRGPRPAAGQVQELIDTGGKGTANSRSGYAIDKYPQLVDGDEARGKAVPIASEKGAQVGRVPPAQRKGGAHYEAVTAEVAMARARQRVAGTLPPIAGGLDDPNAAYDDTRMESADAPGVPVSETTVVPPTSAREPSAAAMETYAKLLTAVESLTAPSATPAPSAPAYDYLEQRSRVNFQLENGTYSIPAIDVREAPLGVIIVLPYSEQDATFTPNPGTKVRIGWKGQTWDCYFPGTSFELPDLGVLVITMIRSDEG